jgi:alanine racemase
LQFNRVDYLAVAYTDEGVELRKNGITLPIMVMNPELHSFETMIQNQLEPDIYSVQLLEKFLETVSLLRSPSDEPYPIHLELETGMNRLGFEENQLDDLLKQLVFHPFVAHRFYLLSSGSERRCFTRRIHTTANCLV